MEIEEDSDRHVCLKKLK